MPANLHIEVSVALLRDRKTLRSVSREAHLPFETIRNVIGGRFGMKKKIPSSAAARVLRALRPYLPEDFVAQINREFPSIFAPSVTRHKKKQRGPR